MKKNQMPSFVQRLKLVSAFFLLLIISRQGFTADGVRGINYDPIHSVEFAHGMGTDNADVMRSAIIHDLDQLKIIQVNNSLKITHLKTFFTTYQSLHGTAQVNIADVVYAWNQDNPDYALTLGLGIYEFKQSNGCAENCVAWTQKQIEAAEYALLTYNNEKNHPLIDRVFIGNEDMQYAEVRDRIASDITNLKQFLQVQKIPGVKVGTAQISGNVLEMFKGDAKYKSIYSVADFIGTNVYPFWGGSAYSDAKKSFESYWKELKSTKLWKNKEVIETEEGWPSNDGGEPQGVGRATLPNAYDYFSYWYYRGRTNKKPSIDPVVPVSYYFALNDKLPFQGIESNWGLVSADNSSNLLDNFQSGGKQFASNIVFPGFYNYLGSSNGIVYNKQDIHKATVLACTDNRGQGSCYPLYGYENSSTLPELKTGIWQPDAQGWNINPPSKTAMMVDTSLQFYKSILIVANAGVSYPAVCFINSDRLTQLTNDSRIEAIWPADG